MNLKINFEFKNIVLSLYSHSKIMKEEYQHILKTIRDIPQEELSKIFSEDLKDFEGVGLTVDEFIHCHKQYTFKNNSPDQENICTFDQKFTSGFFMS